MAVQAELPAHIRQLMTDLTLLGGQPEVETEAGNYTRIRMADSCYTEVLDYGDSLLVVQTVCAPVCSSRARVYNKEWTLLRDVEPTVTGIFPYATITDGQLRWEDHTDRILDEDERKHRREQQAGNE